MSLFISRMCRGTEKMFVRSNRSLLRRGRAIWWQLAETHGEWAEWLCNAQDRWQTVDVECWAFYENLHNGHRVFWRSTNMSHNLRYCEIYVEKSEIWVLKMCGCMRQKRKYINLFILNPPPPKKNNINIHFWPGWSSVASEGSMWVLTLWNDDDHHHYYMKENGDSILQGLCWSLH